MNKMKLTIAILIGILVVASGSLFFMTKNIEKNENRLYDESTVATADDIFKKDGKNIYYFYQEQCSHCNDAKPELLKFKDANDKAKTDVEFNIVDMADAKNQDLWYQGTDYTTDKNYKSEAADIKSLDDLQIIGTPSMIYVEDGKVKDYQVGNDAIYQMVNEISKDLGLDVTIGN